MERNDCGDFFTRFHDDVAAYVACRARKPRSCPIIEDAVHQSYLDVELKSPGRYPPEILIGSWKTAAWREYLRLCTDHAKHKRLVNATATLVRVGETDRVFLQAVEEFVGTLDDADRTLIALLCHLPRYIVMERLGVSMSTIGRRLASIRERFDKFLERRDAA